MKRKQQRSFRIFWISRLQAARPFLWERWWRGKKYPFRQRRRRQRSARLRFLFFQRPSGKPEGSGKSDGGGSGRIALAKTSAILDGNDPGVTYASQYAGTGYEDAASDIARVLNEAATERAQAAYEQQLTEELQKAANDIHYGNAHAGIHVTIHRVQDIPDRLIRQYEEVAPPLLRLQRLQSSILPLLKEEAEGGKQKNLLYGRRLDMRSFHHQDGSFFIRTRLPADEQRLAVGLLIDESGSMAGVTVSLTPERQPLSFMTSVSAWGSR